jgi:hypothetical protein
MYSKNVVTTHITTTTAENIQISIPNILLYFLILPHALQSILNIRNVLVTLQADVMYYNEVGAKNHVENVTHV